jgi:hypothetical protein
MLASRAANLSRRRPVLRSCSTRGRLLGIAGLVHSACSHRRTSIRAGAMARALAVPLLSSRQRADRGLQNRAFACRWQAPRLSRTALGRRKEEQICTSCTSEKSLQQPVSAAVAIDPGCGTGVDPDVTGERREAPRRQVGRDKIMETLLFLAFSERPKPRASRAGDRALMDVRRRQRWRYSLGRRPVQRRNARLKALGSE